MKQDFNVLIKNTIIEMDDHKDYSERVMERIKAEKLVPKRRRKNIVAVVLAALFVCSTMVYASVQLLVNFNLMNEKNEVVANVQIHDTSNSKINVSIEDEAARNQFMDTLWEREDLKNKDYVVIDTNLKFPENHIVSLNVKRVNKHSEMPVIVDFPVLPRKLGNFNFREVAIYYDYDNELMSEQKIDALIAKHQVSDERFIAVPLEAKDIEWISYTYVDIATRVKFDIQIQKSLEKSTRYLFTDRPEAYEVVKIGGDDAVLLQTSHIGERVIGNIVIPIESENNYSVEFISEGTGHDVTVRTSDGYKKVEGQDANGQKIIIYRYPETNRMTVLELTTAVKAEIDK